MLQVVVMGAIQQLAGYKLKIHKPPEDCPIAYRSPWTYVSRFFGDAYPWTEKGQGDFKKSSYD